MTQTTKLLADFLSRTVFCGERDPMRKIQFALSAGLPCLLADAPSFLPPLPSLDSLCLAPQREVNAFLLAEMAELTAALSAAGVRFVFLKGPLLGQLLYAPACLRPTSDIDLLTAYEDVAKAMDVLGALGYTYDNGSPYSGAGYAYDYSKGDTRLKIMGRHSVCVRCKGDRTSTVELHVQPFRSYGATTNQTLRTISDAVFARVQWVECGGQRYPILSHIDNFLMLCTHFARHAVEAVTKFCSAGAAKLFPLGALHDLALYHTAFGADWTADTLVSVAEAYGCAVDLAFAARYLAEIYAFSVFGEIFRRLEAALPRDAESVSYVEICRNWGARDLLCEDGRTLLARLRALCPPQKVYPLQEGVAFPVPDCEVAEIADDPADVRVTRRLLRYSWGAAVENERLRFCVKIAERDLWFAPQAGDAANVHFRIRSTKFDCSQNCGGCNQTYLLRFRRDHAGVAADLYDGRDGQSRPCAVTCREGEVLAYFDLPLADPNRDAWRFILSAEVCFPRPHDPTRNCTFALRWIDSVTISHQTCLCYGELRRGQSAATDDRLTHA